MSETEVREALAEAASAVDGVNVTPWYRQTNKAGQGYVRLDTVNYPNATGGVVTWQVCVLLPQDIATAEKWLAEKAFAVANAVNDHMRVRSYQPVQLLTDGGALPAVVIEGTREQE